MGKSVKSVNEAEFNSILNFLKDNDIDREYKVKNVDKPYFTLVINGKLTICKNAKEIAEKSNGGRETKTTRDTFKELGDNEYIEDGYWYSTSKNGKIIVRPVYKISSLENAPQEMKQKLNTTASVVDATLDYTTKITRIANNIIGTFSLPRQFAEGVAEMVTMDYGQIFKNAHLTQDNETLRLEAEKNILQLQKELTEIKLKIIRIDFSPLDPGRIPMTEIDNLLPTYLSELEAGSNEYKLIQNYYEKNTYLEMWEKIKRGGSESGGGF